MKRKRRDYQTLNLDFNLDPNDVKKYMLAGQSVFTVFNMNTGNHMTYKIDRKKSKSENEQLLWFVSVCYSYDSFSCIGRILNNKFLPSMKMDVNDKSVKGFDVVWKHYGENLNPMNNVKILHSGYCARCGKLLTEPESLKRGMGSYCANVSTNF